MKYLRLLEIVYKNATLMLNLIASYLAKLIQTILD